MPKLWFKVSLFNFFFAACMGALLRFAFVEEISWLTFTYWMHGHSHVAMLGWLYMALCAFIIHFFVPKDVANSRSLKILFGFTELSVLGMMVFFPLQGYGGTASFFSSLHIILSYFLVRNIWKYGEWSINRSWSQVFLKSAFIFMILSTLAIWSLIPIMMTGRAGSALYYGAVQFYLHFQFNGWFLFGILALLFKILESNNIEVPERKTKLFYYLLVIGTLMTFALAVTWSTPLPALFLINSIGVIIQLSALLVFYIVIRQLWPQISEAFNSWGYRLLSLSLIALGVKVLAQSAVVLPHFATVAYTIRNYVIGFIHLILLGMVSCFLLAYSHRLKFITFESPISRFGIYSFLFGLLLSESVLFLQGTMFWASLGFLPAYYSMLFGVSVLMPIGIAAIIIGNKTWRPG